MGNIEDVTMTCSISGYEIRDRSNQIQINTCAKVSPNVNTSKDEEDRSSIKSTGYEYIEKERN